MSNGCEIIARLPNPNAGPSFFTTASEVATRHFVCKGNCFFLGELINKKKLRDQLGIPIPRIYDWSSNASNEIGAEYILEERATGQPLGNLWETISLSTKVRIVDQILDIEKKLASMTFSKHGCIHYASDLQSKSCDYELIETKRNYPSESAARGNGTTPSFAIGPSTSPIFWEKQKATMNLDRGPCTLLSHKGSQSTELTMFRGLYHGLCGSHRKKRNSMGYFSCSAENELSSVDRVARNAR